MGKVRIFIFHLWECMTLDTNIFLNFLRRKFLGIIKKYPKRERFRSQYKIMVDAPDASHHQTQTFQIMIYNYTTS